MNNSVEKLGLRILELNEQLQAETQRADKAQEMVANFRTFLFHSDKCFKNQMASNWKEPCICQVDEIRENSRPFEQAFRQKLCDEIVGKIQAQRKELAYTMLPEEAIEIVKSVLAGEG